jgi:DNA-binding NarL/FixJ family response regulator
MFSSKIRTTAQQLGLPVTFARSLEQIVSEARSGAPTLAIFDLNSVRCQPLAAIVALKADPELARIPTVGFVSHVQTDLIEAARGTGLDEILPRSAFTAQLASILERGR